MADDDAWIVSLAHARVAPPEVGRQTPLLMKHGSMTVRYYAPRGVDPQTPHDQDELYVVMSGSGYFLNGKREDVLQRKAFGPGDVIFVPAGNIHRFVDFTNDFGAWVIFWGPVGGERS